MSRQIDEAMAGWAAEEERADRLKTKNAVLRSRAERAETALREAEEALTRDSNVDDRDWWTNDPCVRIKKALAVLTKLEAAEHSGRVSV